jgi:RNA recognition motif-containing protein
MAGTRLFVGNLPYATTVQELTDLFRRSGDEVASARLVTDLDTGRPRGYAFVEMESADAAAKAIQTLHHFNLNGRPIVVAEARERPQEVRPHDHRP